MNGFPRQVPMYTADARPSIQSHVHQARSRSCSCGAVSWLREIEPGTVDELELSCRVQPMIRGFATGWLAAALVYAGLATPPDATASEPGFSLYALDAPLVRTDVVEIGFVPASGSPFGSGTDFILSNDDTSVNGVLANGVGVQITGPWQLADGSDGPRTVFGQTRNAGAAWSEIVALELVLDRGGTTAIVIDSDPGLLVTPEGEHTVLTGPNDRVAAVHSPLTPGAGSVAFLSGRWQFTVTNRG